MSAAARSSVEGSYLNRNRRNDTIVFRYVERDDGQMFSALSSLKIAEFCIAGRISGKLEMMKF